MIRDLLKPPSRSRVIKQIIKHLCYFHFFLNGKGNNLGHTIEVNDKLHENTC